MFTYAGSSYLEFSRKVRHLSGVRDCVRIANEIGFALGQIICDDYYSVSFRNKCREKFIDLKFVCLDKADEYYFSARLDKSYGK